MHCRIRQNISSCFSCVLSFGRVKLHQVTLSVLEGILFDYTCMTFRWIAHLSVSTSAAGCKLASWSTGTQTGISVPERLQSQGVRGTETVVPRHYLPSWCSWQSLDMLPLAVSSVSVLCLS